MAITPPMTVVLSGPLREIEETSVSTKNFRWRNAVVDCEVEYQQGKTVEMPIKFKLVKDDCKALDGVAVGSVVKVECEVRGRAWQNREGQTSYFVDLEARRIKVESLTEAAPATVPDDDIPF